MTPYQSYKPPSDALSTPISLPPTDRSHPASSRIPLAPTGAYTPNTTHAAAQHSHHALAQLTPLSVNNNNNNNHDSSKTFGSGSTRPSDTFEDSYHAHTLTHENRVLPTPTPTAYSLGREPVPPGSSRPHAPFSKISSASIGRDSDNKQNQNQNQNPYDSYRTVYNPTPLSSALSKPHPHPTSLASYHYQPPTRLPFSTPTPASSANANAENIPNGVNARHLYTPSSTFTFSSPHTGGFTMPRGRQTTTATARNAQAPTSPTRPRALRTSGSAAHPTLPALPDLFTPRITPSLSRTSSFQTSTGSSTIPNSSPCVAINARKRKCPPTVQTPAPPPRRRRWIRGSDEKWYNVGCLMAPANVPNPLPEAFVQEKPAIDSTSSTSNPWDYVPAPKRIKNSIEQLEFLWTVWDLHQMPDGELKQRVGHWIGLPTHNVTIWLQNNRQYSRGPKKDKKTMWSVHAPRVPSEEERDLVDAIMNGHIVPEDARRVDLGLLTPTATDTSPGSSRGAGPSRLSTWSSPTNAGDHESEEGRPVNKQARTRGQLYTPDSELLGAAIEGPSSQASQDGTNASGPHELAELFQVADADAADAPRSDGSDGSTSSDDESRGRMVAAEAAHILMTIMMTPNAQQSAGVRQE